MKVIGLAGLKGSGKDAFADRLVIELRRLNVWTARRAFADALKKTIGFLFAFDDAQLNQNALKEANDPEWGFSPRLALRALSCCRSSDRRSSPAACPCSSLPRFFTHSASRSLHACRSHGARRQLLERAVLLPWLLEKEAE